MARLKVDRARFDEQNGLGVFEGKFRHALGIFECWKTKGSPIGEPFWHVVKGGGRSGAGFASQCAGGSIPPASIFDVLDDVTSLAQAVEVALDVLDDVVVVARLEAVAVLIEAFQVLESAFVLDLFGDLNISSVILIDVLLVPGPIAPHPVASVLVAALG